MFALMFFLVGGMMIVWILVIAYAIGKGNAEARRQREWNEDFNRAIEEMDDSGEWWEWRMPKWYTDKYGF